MTFDVTSPPPREWTTLARKDPMCISTKQLLYGGSKSLLKEILLAWRHIEALAIVDHAAEASALLDLLQDQFPSWTTSIRTKALKLLGVQEDDASDNMGHMVLFVSVFLWCRADSSTRARFLPLVNDEIAALTDCFWEYKQSEKIAVKQAAQIAGVWARFCADLVRQLTYACVEGTDSPGIIRT